MPPLPKVFLSYHVTFQFHHLLVQSCFSPLNLLYPLGRGKKALLSPSPSSTFRTIILPKVLFFCFINCKLKRVEFWLKLLIATCCPLIVKEKRSEKWNLATSSDLELKHISRSMVASYSWGMSCTWSEAYGYYLLGLRPENIF